MRNKWASCSTAGNLNFNAELLELDRATGDYVIVHELLHFSVPNHGKLWKTLMRAHQGDYEHAEKERQKLTLGPAKQQSGEKCGLRPIQRQTAPPPACGAAAVCLSCQWRLKPGPAQHLQNKLFINVNGNLKYYIIV